MPLSWNEIRLRANAFVNEWKDKAPKAREEADAQDFQTDFLGIFGVSRRQVATFEHRVNINSQIGSLGEATGGRRGYIDLFWKGRFIIEMKTPGKDMVKAYEQAKEYAVNLPRADIPEGILISDFNKFDYYNLEKNNEVEHFTLEELPEKVELFSYLAGYKDIVFQAASPVDIEAAEHMGELYDALKDNGYTGHELEMYSVRLLFCLFADGSGIFDEKNLFYKYILDRTNEDGSDLALHLGQIFDILNKPLDKRLKNIDETLNKFPYVNGGLFEEKLETASFDSVMRKTLLKCCTLDWSQIKPEIFGAMFQSVKDKESRRALGEHYTSETNILKVIRPLFLDELWADFEKIRKLTSGLRQQRLLEFHTRLRELKFLDPACGCGNFLVVSYRELRLLEIEVLSEYMQKQQVTDIELLIRVNVDQFYGIEIEEFPARIAQTALWLMDHLMNKKASQKFGQYFVRIPLTASPHIINDNALSLDWEKVVPKDELSYILGNPPFIGASMMTAEQKIEATAIFGKIKLSNSIDYVGAWYHLAAKYIKGTHIEVAFVSTNSITQGEQVAPLWGKMLGEYGVLINFAYRTFKWSNEAKGKAAVHCVIIGFSTKAKNKKEIYEDNSQFEAKNISPYLIDAPNIIISSRSSALCNVPQIFLGNKPTDDGNLILTTDEKEELLSKEPHAEKLIRRYIGSEEFINGKERFCIWLNNVPYSDVKKCPLVLQRIEKVKQFRLKSTAKPTVEKAEQPHLFFFISHPDSDYLLIPSTSSENRKYIPIGYMDKDTISSNANMIIPNATLYHFGVLTSTMHMAWTRVVCGRLEMRYRYTGAVVYNNFPWPKPSEKQEAEIEKYAQQVLRARKDYPDSTLAELYGETSLAFYTKLVKAHNALDKAVDEAYGKTFNTEAERVSHLFYLYQKLTEGLLADVPKHKKQKRV